MTAVDSQADWIYLDHCATTPLVPAARDALEAHLHLANPSSVHGPGREARHALTGARRTFAELLGVDRDQVVFTGNGSEANVLALSGAIAALPRERRVVLTTPVEHSCVRNVLEAHAAKGAISVRLLDVDRDGRVHPETLARSLSNATGLVSVMTANHEIGTIQPVAELCALARDAGARFHSDACQAIGRIDLSAAQIAADVLTFSAHKFGGPRGVGGLVRAPDFELDSPFSAGRQEFGLRGGTEDVASCVAATVALRSALQRLADSNATLAVLRAHLLDRLSRDFPDAVVHSPREHALLALVNFSFPRIPGAWLVAALDRRRIAVSHGSACSSRAALPSPVLIAIGREDVARNAIRVSMSPTTTRDQLDAFCARLRDAVDEMRTAQSF